MTTPAADNDTAGRRGDGRACFLHADPDNAPVLGRLEGSDGDLGPYSDGRGTRETGLHGSPRSGTSRSARRKRHHTTMGTFAETMPDRRTLESAVASACRAPSLHNSQPWRWVLGTTELRLFSDPDRILPATDPSGRQMVLSCGAVLHHLQTALLARVGGGHRPADARVVPRSVGHAPVPPYPRRPRAGVTDSGRDRASTDRAAPDAGPTAVAEDRCPIAGPRRGHRCTARCDR